MRLKEHQQELDNMTDDQKFERTKAEKFMQRWTMIRLYEHWYMTENEYPHGWDRYKEKVIRLKKRGRPEWMRYSLREEIREHIKEWYAIQISASESRSVKCRPHIHLYKTANQNVSTNKDKD